MPRSIKTRKNPPKAQDDFGKQWKLSDIDNFMSERTRQIVEPNSPFKNYAKHDYVKFFEKLPSEDSSGLSKSMRADSLFGYHMKEMQNRDQMDSKDFLTSLTKPKKLNLDKISDPTVNLARHRLLVSKLRQENKELREHIKVIKEAQKVEIKNIQTALRIEIEKEFEIRVQRMAETLKLAQHGAKTIRDPEIIDMQNQKTIEKLAQFIVYQELRFNDIIHKIRMDLIDEAREIALDPSSAISKLITEGAIKEHDFDFRIDNINSDIKTFSDAYNRYIEAIKRKKLTKRKDRKAIAKDIKTWRGLREIIPEVIPISNLIQTIKTGRARFFFNKLNSNLKEEATFEAQWEPKNALNDVLTETKIYKLKIDQLTEEINTLKSLTENFMEEIAAKDGKISTLKKQLFSLENDKKEKITNIELLHKRYKEELRELEEENRTQIDKIQKDFEIEHKLWKQIDKRRKKYANYLAKQLVLAKNIIKRPKDMMKMTREMNFKIIQHLSPGPKSTERIKSSRKDRKTVLSLNTSRTRINTQLDRNMTQSSIKFVNFNS
ncbi:unnamed protein product [Moneuplotes crassus]|uniref:Uncharacterized protein n=1 Tax=Euplotes crassus TaxID=5936 RepID=A0AAD1Y598_EUPCR|nr:unnamed protein product [Moneuplotes crassus]